MASNEEIYMRVINILMLMFDAIICSKNAKPLLLKIACSVFTYVCIQVCVCIQVIGVCIG